MAISHGLAGMGGAAAGAAAVGGYAAQTVGLNDPKWLQKWIEVVKKWWRSGGEVVVLRG